MSLASTLAELPGHLFLGITEEIVLRRKNRSALYGAFMIPRSLEDLKVPVYCSFRVRPCVPGAPVCSRLPADPEVPVHRSIRACMFVLDAPVGLRQLEDLDVPVLDSNRARSLSQGHQWARVHWRTLR